MADITPFVLALMVLIATATDLANGKIYDWLTLPAMVLGLAMHFWSLRLPGLGFSLAGLCLGGMIFFPACYLGGMGAGDAKLMAAIGAWMGWVFVLNTAIYAALVGGVVAVVILLAKGELLATLARLGQAALGLVRSKHRAELLASGHSLPYAGILALGTVAAYFLPSMVK